MPPFNIITPDELKRTSYDDDPRIIFLLYEGKNTEHLVINPLLASNIIIKHNHVLFEQVEKSGNDEGVTDPKTLILKANAKIEELVSENKFRRGRDKFLVMFDLDVLNGKQTKINRLLEIKDEDIILAYTNPAIELFLLLTIKDGYENIVKPNEEKILKNDFVLNDDNDKNNRDRYVLKLVKDNLYIDPKNSLTDFSFVLENISYALTQENNLNRSLKKASNKLTSNIAYILNKIEEDDYDISY